MEKSHDSITPLVATGPLVSPMRPTGGGEWGVLVVGDATMKTGYVKLFRQLQDHPLWLGERFTRGQAWVDLLMLAQFTSYELRIRGNPVHLDRGQIGHSKAHLGGRWKWDRKTVQRFLDDLESDGMITQRKTRVVTVVTIVNYDRWQGMDQPRDGGSTQQNPQQTGQQNPQQDPQQSGQQNGHKEESKESKEGEEGEEDTLFALTNSPVLKDTPETILKVFNATEGVTKARKLNAARLKAARARLKDPDWAWREALAKFPLGFQGTTSMWLPALDFFLRPDSVMHILEGKYDGEPVPSGPKSRGVNISEIDLV